MSWHPLFWDADYWGTPALYEVSLGLAADPLDALSTIDWTDITEDVLRFSFSRGRSTERNPVSAGTASITVDNQSGDYDPMNSSGAHYPDLRPNRRLRIAASYEGTTYYLFTGFIDDLKLLRAGAHSSAVEISATDGSKMLNLIHLRNPYEAAVLSFGPRSYYRFQEDGGTAQVALKDSSGNGHDGALYNPLQTIDGRREGYELTGRGDAPGGRVLRSWDEAIDHSSETSKREYAAYGRLPGAGVSGTGDFTLSFIYTRASYNDGGPNGSLLMQGADLVSVGSDNLSFQEQEFTEGSLGMRLRVHRAGGTILDEQFIAIGHFNELGNFVYDSTGRQGSHKIWLTREDDTFTLVIKPMSYRDSSSYFYVFTASDIPDFATSLVWLLTINAHQYLNGTYYTFAGDLAEVVVWPTALTSGDRSTLDATVYAWDGDLPGDRIDHVLDQVGWPAADRDVEPGVTQLGRFDQEGASAMAHIEAVADTEDGLFYFDGEGKAVFHGRHHLITDARSTASQVTFGDGAGEVAYLASGLTPHLSERDIYNEIICERDGGLPQSASDAASISAFGQRTLSESGLLARSDNDMLARAQHKAQRYANPLARVRSMTFTRDDSSDAFYPAALGTQLWDRVTYRQRLVNSTMWDQDSIVEGCSIEYDGRQRDLRTTLSLSTLAASLADEDFWVLNTSELGTDTRLAY